MTSKAVDNTEINVGLVDFHSHFLPGMDDGAKNTDEAVAMLKMMAEQGVKKVIATPHFYAERETPEAFLSRREKACRDLASFIDKGFPSLYLGAEVAYFPGIGHCEFLKSLNVCGTNLILIEMPFERWSDVVVDELLSLKSRFGLTPVVAHIERYINQPRGTLERLVAEGIYIQSNAEFFLTLHTRRKAISLLESGIVQILGSDCHHIDRRAPNLGHAAEYIRKKLGAPFVNNLFTAADLLLG